MAATTGLLPRRGGFAQICVGRRRLGLLVPGLWEPWPAGLWHACSMAAVCWLPPGICPTESRRHGWFLSDLSGSGSLGCALDWERRFLPVPPVVGGRVMSSVCNAVVRGSGCQGGDPGWSSTRVAHRHVSSWCVGCFLWLCGWMGRVVAVGGPGDLARLLLLVVIEPGSRSRGPSHVVVGLPMWWAQ